MREIGQTRTAARIVCVIVRRRETDVSRGTMIGRGERGAETEPTTNIQKPWLTNLMALDVFYLRNNRELLDDAPSIPSEPRCFRHKRADLV